MISDNEAPTPSENVIPLGHRFTIVAEPPQGYACTMQLAQFTRDGQTALCQKWVCKAKSVWVVVPHYEA